MSQFATSKLKTSFLSVPKRISGLTIFASMILLFYAFFPWNFSNDPRQTLPYEHQLTGGIPTAPVAQQVSEERGARIDRAYDGWLDKDGRVGGEASEGSEEEHPRVDKEEAPVDKKTAFAPGCLRKVIYDKPVKTGSTALTYAIREYLKETGRIDMRCDHLGDSSCAKQVERMCLGTHPRQSEEPSFLGHLKQANGSTIECLKKMGYYAVTSIRDPYQRRKSAYLYNKTIKGNHFSIPHTVSFEEFMERMPRCSLFDYYDGLGHHCDVGIKIEERVRRITDRYDEVIELGEEPRGKLFKKIVKYVARENESKKEDVRDMFDEESLREETMLYNALKEKMISGSSERVPC